MDDPHLALHEARRQTLPAEAARAHLTALASCCRPSALTAAARRAVAHVGGLLHLGRTQDSCCA